MQKQRSIKWWILGALTTVIGLFLLARIYYAVTDDFRLSNITYEMPFHQEWSIATPSPVEDEHLQKILDQPFTYLGKGAQSYVFSSEDGLYVLKFFKFKHLRPAWFYEWMPSIGPIKTYKEKLRARKQRKLFGVFRAYKLAYDADKKGKRSYLYSVEYPWQPEKNSHDL